MITLRTTVIGRAQLNAALAGDGPAPVLASMVIGSDAPPDPASASASNLAPVQPAAQLVIARHTADIISGSAGFDAPASADVITWLALLYADGTPAAVGAIDGGLPRIPGLRLELTWAWASTDSGDLALDISIIDINALRQQLYNAVRADLDANNLGIAETRIKPVERAMQHVLRDGNPLMHCELFADPYNLRGGNALAISGVIAGDDSIDLAEHTETLLSGDYLIFGGGNTETVRLLANLELGRRRLQSDILHTYPTATLSRTNWTVTAGEAIALAGQVYYSKPLPLADNARTHRVIIRSLTAAAAPVVAMRADSDGDYIDGMLINTRPAADGSADYSDYLYDVVCADAVGHLRITTPAATRVLAVVVASEDPVTRVVAIDNAVFPTGTPLGGGAFVEISAKSFIAANIIEFRVSSGNYRQRHRPNINSNTVKFWIDDASNSGVLSASAVDALGNVSERRTVRLQRSLTFDPLKHHPVQFGEYWRGGFYAGKFLLNGNVYALLVAPKQYEFNGPWGPPQLANAFSEIDGWDNTAKMASAGSSAARNVRSMQHDGFSDYFIPSISQLDIIYRALKPSGAVNQIGTRSAGSIGNLSPGNGSGGLVVAALGANQYSIPAGEAYSKDAPRQTLAPEFIGITGAQAFDAFTQGFYGHYWSSTEHSSNGSIGYAWAKTMGLYMRDTSSGQVIESTSVAGGEGETNKDDHHSNMFFRPVRQELLTA